MQLGLNNELRNPRGYPFTEHSVSPILNGSYFTHGVCDFRSVSADSWQF